MSTGGKIALFAIAIGIFTKVMEHVMDASNRAEEEANKVAEASKQTVSNIEQQQNSLDSLVDQYKSLAAQSKTDLSVRKELTSVQQEINKLVGGEIDGLDLVNGKLDEQLAKIREKARINAGEYNTEYSKATQNTIKAAENTTMYNGRGFDMEKTLRLRVVDVYDKNGNNDAMTGVSNAFKKALEDADINVTYTLEADNTSTNDFALPDDVLKRYEAIKKIVQWLKENGYTAGEVWDKFTDAEIRLKKAIDGVVDSASKEVNNVLLGSDNMSSNVNTVEDYVNMRDKLIEEVKQSPGIADALDKGYIDEDWVNQTVDNYLSGLEQYSDVYTEWWNKFGSDAAKGVEELKNKLQSEDFNTWIDGLDYKDRDLVYEISLKTDTAKWQLDDWQKALKNAKANVEESESLLPEIFSSKGSEDSETFSARIKTYRENINSLTEALEKYRNEDYGDGGFNGFFLDLIDKFPQLAGHADDLEAAINNLMNSMDSDMVSDFDNQIEKLESESDVSALEDVKSKLLGVRNAVSGLKTTLDGATSAFSTVKSALDEYNENGFITAETLSSILALEPQYLNLLVDENGQLNLNSESYAKLVKAKLENLLVSQMQSSFDSVLGLTVEQAEAYAAAEAYDVETESIYALLGAKMKLAMASARDKDAINGTNAYSAAVLRTAQAYAPLVSMIESYDFANERATGTTNSSTDAINEQKQALENQKKALEDSKKALEDYKSDLSDAQSAIKSLIDAVTDYIKQQKEDEKSALQERKDAFDELIEKEKEELAAKKESAKFDEELAKKQSTVAKNALAASIASLDDSAAGRKAQKQANDALAESRSDLASTLADHEYDIRVKALDELKSKNDEYYDAETKKIDDYLSNARKLYEDACSLIENDTGDLYGKLWDYTYKHTTQTKAEFDNMWSAAQEAMERYGVGQLGVVGLMEFLQGAIYDTEDKIKTLDKEISGLSGVIDSVSESINNMANNSLGNVASHIDEIRKEYEKLLKSMQEQADAVYKPKWYTIYHGIKIEAMSENVDSAREELKRKIKQMFGDDNPGFQFQHYASGTYSAVGGASVVGERGAELRLINHGDGIVTAGATKGLEALGNAIGSNPLQFIKDAGQMLMKNLFGNGANPSLGAISNNNQIAPNISITVQGDATQTTVKAIEAVANDIINKTTRNIMNAPLKYKRLI